MSRHDHDRRLSPLTLLSMVAGLLLGACAGGQERPPAATVTSSSPVGTAVDGATTTGSGSSTASDTGAGRDGGIDADVVVDAVGPGVPIDPRVFGTNVPAWLAERLRDPQFQRLTLDTGATIIRMPGGSWSNGYDWLACEQADPANCLWTWAARPSDFIAFMTETGLPGMWTVSINETAEQAAAAVAFFNGRVDDTRVIGVDRDGVDWGTVGAWAELRAAGGHSEPLPIQLWEVGNEVYGGKPSFGGPSCAEFGWEDVWTCDGTEYVIGNSNHDGYLDIRAAMVAVDPTIEVGAVGIAPPSAWSNWGSDVIEAAGDDLDFFSVHHYGFDRSPDPQEAVLKPASEWPGLLRSVRDALPDGVPIAVTEYNLVAFESGDADDVMELTANGLYLADTIGQFVVGGVAIANQWLVANGTDPEGTTYGLFNASNNEPSPQYDAFVVWSRMGATLLDTQIDRSLDMPALRVYSSRHDDGSLTLMVLNLGPVERRLTFGLDGVDPAVERRATISTYRSGALVDRAFDRDTGIVIGDFDELGQPWDVSPWSMHLIDIAEG